jgi:type I restriction-modification system DNA methylase subunit
MAIPIGEYKQAVEALAQRMKAFYDKAIIDIEKEWKRNYIKGSKFANEIEALAQETNQEIDNRFVERFCHKAVMTLMLKFLFLRFTEDKKILKPYFRSEATEKWQKENKEVQEIIREAFEKARGKFKGLYKITVYDEFLPSKESLETYLIDALSNEPCSGLYKDRGSLDFATLDPTVVSAFYERLFERKKRKELGLFFTPPVIAEYLVEKALEGQKITKDFLVLDPACGSGQILLAAYKKLKDIFVNQLGMTSSGAHKQILSHNLWGVDVEPFAVLLSKINLAIQDLENVPEYINIIHGDSLLETGFDIPQMAMLKDVGEKQKQKLVKETIQTQGGKEITFWRNGQGRIFFEKPVEQTLLFELAERMKTGIFSEESGIRTMKDLPKELDAVVANPPYVSAKFLKKEYKEKLGKIYESAYKIYDLYVLFVELAINKLKESGKLSFIMPNKFLASDYGEKIRKIILTKTNIKELLSVSGIEIFEDSSVYPIILTLKRETETANKAKFQLGIIDELSNLYKEKRFQMSRDVFQRLGIFVILSFNKLKLIEKLIKNSQIEYLENIVDPSYRPLSFTNWGKYLKLIVSEEPKDREFVRLIGTTSIFAYSIRWNREFRYGKYKFKKSYLPRYKNFKNWDDFTTPKLLVKEISTQLIVALDKQGKFGYLTGIYGLIPKKRGTDLKYLLCLLNSSLLRFFYHSLFYSLHLAGGYMRFNWSFLKRIPIVSAKPDQQKPFIKIADKMLELNQKLQTTEKSFYEFIEEKVENKISLREISGLNFVNIRDSRARLGDKGKINTGQEENTLTVFINKKPIIKMICADKISAEFLTKYLDDLRTNILAGKDGDSWIERILNSKIHWDKKSNLERLLEEYKNLQSSAEEIKKQIAETDREIDEMVYDLYGMTEEEKKVIESSS